MPQNHYICSKGIKIIKPIKPFLKLKVNTYILLKKLAVLNLQKCQAGGKMVDEKRKKPTLLFI